MPSPAFTKRAALRAGGALAALAALVGPARAALPTPRATEGPFYPTPAMRYTDADNDLTRMGGGVAAGEHVVLQGVVRNLAGDPLPGARIEIWQCDANGRYLHAGDWSQAPLDPYFQGFGYVVVGADGAYAFRTIKPAAYPGRTPHIHVKAFYGGRVLTTQFYTKDEPQNARDGLFRRLSPTEQAAVEMDFQPGPNGPTALRDVVLNV